MSVRHVSRLAKEEVGEGVAVAIRPRLSLFVPLNPSFLPSMQSGGRGVMLTATRALKAVVRARCGFMDVTAERLDGFVEVWRQSRDLTDAGMALAKAVRRGRLVLADEDRALVSELVELAQKMTRELV